MIYQNFDYIYTDLATSEYCEECCVDCDPDLYCQSVRAIGNTTRTQNYGSANMRYARAIGIGGAKCFSINLQKFILYSYIK